MDPTEGLAVSPWKLHLFTTELSVKDDEGEPYRLMWGNDHQDCFCFQQIEALCFHIVIIIIVDESQMLIYLHIMSVFIAFQ